jgi:hypothetical protein
MKRPIFSLPLHQSQSQVNNGSAQSASDNGLHFSIFSITPPPCLVRIQGPVSIINCNSQTPIRWQVFIFAAESAQTHVSFKLILTHVLREYGIDGCLM